MGNLLESPGTPKAGARLVGAGGCIWCPAFPIQPHVKPWSCFVSVFIGATFSPSVWDMQVSSVQWLGNGSVGMDRGAEGLNEGFVLQHF